MPAFFIYMDVMYAASAGRAGAAVQIRNVRKGIPDLS
jgi:hypothetical protein